jgi:UDP-glucuronate 4-epimerase
MQRDFTYIDDIVEGILRVVSGIEGGAAAPVFRRPAPQIEHTDERGPGQPPHRIYNIGHGSPVKLMDFIAEMEKALGQEAKKNYLPMQPGDVPVTWADTGALERDFGYKPATRLTEGIRRFVGWYREYYGR